MANVWRSMGTEKNAEGPAGVGFAGWCFVWRVVTQGTVDQPKSVEKMR